MTRKKIQVEDYHIKCGEPRHPARCPIAYALGPRIGGHVEVTQDGRVQVYDLEWRMFVVPACRVAVPKQYPSNKLLREFSLPPEAVQWMIDFDSGKKVKPFEFDLEIPKEE